MTDTLVATKTANRLIKGVKTGRMPLFGEQSLPGGLSAQWWVEDTSLVVYVTNPEGEEVALVTIPIN